MDIISTLTYIILAILAIVILSSTFYVVKQKTAVVIETFGKFSKISQSGLHFKLPYPISQIAYEVNLQIGQLAPVVTVKSSDNAFLNIPVKAQFKALESKIKEAAYELDNPHKQIESYIVNKVRSIAAKTTMDNLFLGVKNIDDEVKKDLNEKFSPYGYEIIDLLIDDPQPSEELKRAFDKVLASQREKDAAQNLADALMISKIGEAKAEQKSLELKGLAFVNYRNTVSAGNKLALEIMLGKVKPENKTVTVEEIVEKENGEKEIIKKEVIKVEYVPNEKYEPGDISEKDILKFFEGTDHREALRSVGKNQGNVIISTDSPRLGGTGSLTSEEVLALIKTQITNQKTPSGI